MMDYGYWGDMMGGSGVGLLGSLVCLVLLVDLVLVGIWLYQQVTNKQGRVLDLYTNAFVSVLPYVVPMAIAMILIGIWTSRMAKKKQVQAMESMKQEISDEVVSKVTDGLEKK